MTEKMKQYNFKLRRDIINTNKQVMDYKDAPRYKFQYKMQQYFMEISKIDKGSSSTKRIF